jgi:hypothetical protein
MKRDTIRTLVSFLGNGNGLQALTSEIHNSIRRLQPHMVKVQPMTAPAFNRRETGQLLRNTCPKRRHS